MPMWGINIIKETEPGTPLANTYYGDCGDAEEAKALGDIAVVGERMIFGTVTRFTKMHVWLLGSSAPVFDNKLLTGFGSIATTKPMRKEITLEASFGVFSTYPSTKSYRVSLDTSTLDGQDWGSLAWVEFEEFSDFMEENYFRFTSREGVAFNSFGLERRYGIRQYKKRWYNRKPAE